MPSRGRKFITEFLLPSLNKQLFGSRLMWLDIENKVFQIQWNHKSASDWTTSDAAVFAAWDKKKGHYNPDDKEYYPKSKQRFRAALYKFIKQNHITELCSEEKYTKIYCVGDGKNISETYITVTKSEKENYGSENSETEVKQNPEDLVLDLSSTWNANLLTELQESNSANYHNPEMKEECQESNVVAYYNPEMKEEHFVEQEQVFTDCTNEFIRDALHYENLQSYAQFVNSPTDNKKNISARETSNIIKESDDAKALYVELHLASETSFYKRDNNLKRLKTLENENFHDYLSTVTDTLRFMECPDDEFLIGGDLSFDLPLPCIYC